MKFRHINSDLDKISVFCFFLRVLNSYIFSLLIDIYSHYELRFSQYKLWLDIPRLLTWTCLDTCYKACLRADCILLSFTAILHWRNPQNILCFCSRIQLKINFPNICWSCGEERKNQCNKWILWCSIIFGEGEGGERLCCRT